MTTDADGGDGGRPSICIGCGMCCDGTLYRDVYVVPDDDRAALVTAGLRILPRSNSKEVFEQPCPAFGGGCCSIYEQRPRVCRIYACAVARAHDDGDLSYDRAKALIAATLDVRDRLKPALEPFLSDSERGVLEELYRVLLSKFDPTSVFARTLRDPLKESDPDDFADVLPMVDFCLRRPDLDAPEGRVEVQRRRAERIRAYDALAPGAAALERLPVVVDITAASHTLHDYSTAARFGKEAAGLLAAVRGPDDPETLSAREGVAWWTGMTGRPLESLSMQRELLTDRERVLGPDHPDTLGSRHEVADWTGVCGEPEEALTLHGAVLADRSRVLGADQLVTLDTRHSIAYWTGVAGDGAEALRLYEALLADRQRVQGPDHPDTLTTRAAVAYWTGRLGDPEEAAALSASVLLDSIRVLGADHVDSRQIARAVACWTHITE